MKALYIICFCLGLALLFAACLMNWSFIVEEIEQTLKGLSITRLLLIGGISLLFISFCLWLGHFY